MNGAATVWIVTAVFALSAGLLAWFAVDVGTNTMTRYRQTFTDRARFQAREFFLFIDPTRLFIANLAVMAIGAMVVWLLTGSALVAIPVFFVLALVPRFIYSLLRKHRQRRFEEQLPDALLMISGGLRAGVSLTSAIQQLVAECPPPISQEFALVLREQRMGVTLEQTLNNLGRRMPTQSTVLVVSAMRIATETGGGLAETLERTSATIRARLQMEGKINALTAQGKLQAWVVGLLPIMLMLILNKMEPEAMSMLWHTRIGWGTLAAVAVLEVMGIHVIRRIIAIDV